jgi:hypothetical protein
MCDPPWLVHFDLGTSENITGATGPDSPTSGEGLGETMVL